MKRALIFLALTAICADVFAQQPPAGSPPAAPRPIGGTPAPRRVTPAPNTLQRPVIVNPPPVILTNVVPRPAPNSPVRVPFVTNPPPGSRVPRPVIVTNPPFQRPFATAPFTNVPPMTNAFPVRSANNPPFGQFVATNAPGFGPRATNVAFADQFRTNILLPGQTNLLTRPPMTPAQLQSVNRLLNDLNTIRAANLVTPVQRQQILNTLQASVQSNVKPSQQLLTKLANDLVNGWPRQGLAPLQRSQLAIDINQILNSHLLTPTEVNLAIADLRRVLHAGGMPAASVEALSSDLVAISGEVRAANPLPVQAPIPGAQQ